MNCERLDYPIAATFLNGVIFAQVLLDPASANYGVFDEAERAEFLFRTFKHLALGGPVNQVWLV